jgi:hypothetical protein
VVTSAVTVNRYQPHFLVLPEDDANREIVNGFLLDPSLKIRDIKVEAEAGGWTQVLDSFNSDHIFWMESFPERRMVLLIDLDGNEDRLNRAKSKIPEHLADRVFILGVLTKPEDLKVELGSYETIGLKMSKDCREETDMVWDHPLLRHNKGELDRLRKDFRTILFPSHHKDLGASW